MLFQTHLLLGIVFFLIFGKLFDGNYIAFFLVLLGALLPDLDAPRSKINQWSGFIGKIISLVTRHRGFFHSILFHLIIFLIVSYYFDVIYGQALFLGYLAHIVGDGITKGGVFLFYPFSDFKIKGPIKVGGVFEFIVFVGLLVFIVTRFL